LPVLLVALDGAGFQFSFGRFFEIVLLEQGLDGGGRRDGDDKSKNPNRTLPVIKAKSTVAGWS